MTDTPAPPAPSSTPPVRFVPNGLVVVELGGKRITLRRPKLKEFRDLRDDLRTLNDALNELQEQHADELRRIADEGSALAGDRAEVVAVTRAMLTIGEVVASTAPEGATQADHDADQARLAEFGRWLGARVGKPLADVEVDQADETADKELAQRVRQQTREAGAAFTDALDELRLGWVGTAIETLGGVALSDDDAEAWMASKDFIERLMSHWQSVPFTSGGS